MPSGLVPLANITLGSAASSVTFSSISGSYRDLVLVMTAGNSSGAYSVDARFNGDTASNYNFVRASGNGSTVASSSGTDNILYASFVSKMTTSETITVVANVMDYSATDKHKTVIFRSSESGSGVEMVANRWANTAAITSFQLISPSFNFSAGSTFALYGVSA